MTPAARHRLFRIAALALGIALFALALASIDLATAAGIIAALGWALPAAIGFSALWHLARTWAWARCFPAPRAVSFGRLLRVRLAAEAFSYLTLRGIAGEPLKVLLLAGAVDPKVATAAIALERIAFMVGTTVVIGAGSALALATLPLTPLWTRVFAAFIAVAALVAAAAAAVIFGRGTYLQRLADRPGRSPGRITRFAAAVERQMLTLVRQNPDRLAVLVTATVASYACMVLEVWVVVRAAGAEITAAGALAVETFSRVASFMSAFIPANLGALEAASLAATSAVGVATAGVALALERRVRGLLWAGVGLAIYPRRPTPLSSAARGGGGNGPVLLYAPVAGDVTVPPTTRLAGLPVVERVVRSALRAGSRQVLVWVPPEHGALARRLTGIDSRVRVAGTLDCWRAHLAEITDGSPLVAIGAGTVVSPALLADAAALPLDDGACLDVAAGADWPVSGVLRVAPSLAADPESLAAGLADARARTMTLPSGEDVSHGRARLALRLRSAGELSDAERIIRRSTYKDTDATLARCNRRMSLPISIALMRTPLTPNQLSVSLVAIGFYSAWLFSLGYYLTGVLGAFLSLAASVLDGCDGEIARLKYQESALGCWIETVGDYSYYVAIFLGLTVGAARRTGWEGFYWLGGIAIAGTLLTFAVLIYLRTRITAGQPERMHSIAGARFTAETSWWSRVIWRISFVATRSAMPYGIMALALVHALPAVVVLAAIGANVYWISLVLKLRDLMGGEITARTATG